ncbi:MAG: ribosome silencing factor [Desulfovibrio sp.]|jgi:ribosome-associated protein|nr:ribosome silencing factor [Desulfovibrio sp.]
MEKRESAEASKIEGKLTQIRRRLEELKAERVLCLNLEGKGFFAEGLVVLTANSARHARSLADNVAGLCREKSWEYLHTEGYDLGQWILLDLNDIVVNIFLESARELYRLESLWTYE